MKARLNRIKLAGICAVTAALVVAVASGTAHAAVLAYEGFAVGSATEGGNVNGFTDPASSVNLSGPWTQTYSNGAGIKGRTSSYGWNGAASNLTANSINYPLQNGSYFNFIECNSWGLEQGTAPLATPIDMTGNGTWYMSFVSSSGNSNYAAQMGLNDGTNELMWGNGYVGGSQGLAAHYGPMSSYNNGGAIKGSSGVSPNQSNYDVELYVAELTNTVGTGMNVSVYAYDLNTITNAPSSSDTPLWTTTVSSPTSPFTKLEFDLSGASAYPDIGQLRVGTTWNSVMGIVGTNTWTGLGSGEWSTNVLPTKNWTSGGAPADYSDGNVVLFDDTATGTTSISISAANVSPDTVVFNNGANNYTLSGALGIIGSTTLVKSSSGVLTIANSNGYSGGTTLNGGVLNINNAGAIGTGALVINGGTLGNTSGGPIALSSNNPQTWNASFAFGGPYDLNLGTGSVSLKTTPTVTVSSNNLTIGGVIFGGYGLTKNGAGNLVLGAANTYTGATTIGAGTLTLGAAGTLGSGGLTIVPGGVLDVSAYAGGYNFTGSTLDAGRTSSPATDVNGSLNVTNAVLTQAASNSTLTISGSLAVSGGTVSYLPGDQINLANGTLSLTNTEYITPKVSLGIGTYTLFSYPSGGLATGGTADLAMAGPYGSSGGKPTRSASPAARPSR